MVLADAIGDIEDYVYTLRWLALLVLLYFLPTIVAKSRGVTNFGSIAIINVFLGWTFIGWVIALAMAFKTAPPREVSEVAAWRELSDLQSLHGSDGERLSALPRSVRAVD